MSEKVIIVHPDSVIKRLDRGEFSGPAKDQAQAVVDLWQTVIDGASHLVRINEFPRQPGSSRPQEPVLDGDVYILPGDEIGMLWVVRDCIVPGDEVLVMGSLGQVCVSAVAVYAIEQGAATVQVSLPGTVR